MERCAYEKMQVFEDIDFHKNIAKACVNQYSLLPSNGKPIAGKEWTPVAGIVCKNSRSELKVVALGSGSKCIGEIAARDHNGWRVNDSHAEVLARRSFRRYLLHELKLAIEGKQESIVRQSGNSKLFTFANGVTFHFFCSHIPCGDASIFPNNKHVTIPVRSDIVTNSLKEVQRKRDTGSSEDYDDSTTPIPKRQKVLNSEGHTTEAELENSIRDEYELPTTPTILIPDTHRTGAKCVAGDTPDPKLPGTGYHVTGVLRTKPGRGNPTRSMSCSDKLMKWNFLGCHGALLDHYFTAPVYFSTVTFSGTEFYEEAVKRALITRLTSCKATGRFYVNKPVIGHVEVSCPEWFEGGKKLSHTASVWCLSPYCYEVIVLGLKQGSNSKSAPSKKSSVCVCRKNFFTEFLRLVEATPTDMLPSTLRNIDKTSCAMKNASVNYQMGWKCFIEQFPTWVGNKESTNNRTL